MLHFPSENEVDYVDLGNRMFELKHPLSSCWANNDTKVQLKAREAALKPALAWHKIYELPICFN